MSPPALQALTARRERLWLWLAYYLLVGFQVLWYALWLPPAKLSLPIALTLALVPLLPALIAKWRGHNTALIYAGMACLAYLIFALMEWALGGITRNPAIVQSLICTVFFALWLAVVIKEKRARHRHGRQ
jgi:uncharacterized membrane protein